MEEKVFISGLVAILLVSVSIVLLLRSEGVEKSNSIAPLASSTQILTSPISQNGIPPTLPTTTHDSSLVPSEPVEPQAPVGTVSGGCVVTGCSSEICADEEVYSTCRYRQEYSCYQSARCERQTSGLCGWTETEELKQCLSNQGEV